MNQSQWGKGIGPERKTVWWKINVNTLYHILSLFCNTTTKWSLQELLWFFFFFFFSGALDLDLVLQWSVQWPSDIKILNRAGVQWLCRATPEGGYTSTPKSPRNRTWPPGNVPRPNGAPKQSGVLGLLQGNGSHNAEQLHTAEPLPASGKYQSCCGIF